MTNEEKLLLIDEAITDYQKGVLSEIAALVAIASIVRSRREPTKEDVEWGNKLARKLRITS